MFAKLKQKIQEERGELKLDLTKGCNQATNLQSTCNQEDIPAILDMESNISSKESEITVEEVRALFKGRKEEEILEQLLGKQQDVFSTQLSDLTKDFTTRLETIEKENSELKTEVTMWKDMYFHDHEAAQEVEGFQAHELAKLKNVLLNYQEDLQESKTTLQEIQVRLKETRDRLFSLEEENDRLKLKCDELEEERIRLTDHCAKDSVLINEFKDVKDNLIRKVLELNFLLGENEKKFNKLDEMLSTIQHNYDTLKHNHEMHLKRTEVMTEEKDDTINHLQERIHILERRLGDSLLGDNERISALMTERDTLEAKLEENRQHITEIKRHWNETVICLEKQIVNLNIKMAEDREEGLKNGNPPLKPMLSELLNSIEEIHTLNAYLCGENEHNKEELERNSAELQYKIKHAYKIKNDVRHLLEEQMSDFKGIVEKKENGETHVAETDTVLGNNNLMQ